MQINFIEPDVSRLGGSIQSFLKFADFFKGLGYKIRFISSWNTMFPLPECPKKEFLFEYNKLNNLTLQNFDWNYKQYIATNRWPSNCDLYFVPGWRFLRRIRLPKPMIIWRIIEIPYDNKTLNATIEFWTNSQTIQLRLKNLSKSTHVVRPPHDYTPFRINFKRQRDIDIAFIMRANSAEQKNIMEFVRIAKQYGLRALIIALAHSKQHLDFLKTLGIPFVYNLPKQQVAEYLGRTKVYFHPSKDESCSLAIYEALNSGCFPVVYDVGAAREQLGSLGYVYRSNPDELVLNGLKYSGDRHEFVEQGKKFDIKNTGHVIKQRLAEIQECLL